MEQEELLIKRALVGDEKAFGKIIDTYKNLVFAIILNVVKDKHEAENLAQETFISMYSSLSSYKGPSFKNWIGRIAVNKAIDWNRKSIREGEGLNHYLSQLDKANFLTVPSFEEEIIKAEDIKKLQRLLYKLPSKYGDILDKYFIQSMNYKEIAEQEGISVRTVESRLYRGKRLLQESWKEDG